MTLLNRYTLLSATWRLRCVTFIGVWSWSILGCILGGKLETSATLEVKNHIRFYSVFECVQHSTQGGLVMQSVEVVA